MLTLIDKVCNVTDFHECWGSTLFVQDEERLQKVFPTNGASPLLPAQVDSALRTTDQSGAKSLPLDLTLPLDILCTFLEIVHSWAYLRNI